MKRFARWQFLLLILGAVLTVSLTNCGTPQTQSTPNATGSATGGAAAQTALVFGLGGQPANLEPGNFSDNNTAYVQDQIYDRLLYFKPGTTELTPALATEWSAAADGKTWTFKLREGVKFHDGTPFNAAAVKTNVERWWDPKSPTGFRDAGRNYEIWPGLFGGFKGDPASTVQAISTPDERTVVFVLKEPFAAFPAAIGSSYFGIASPTAIKKAGAKFGIAGSAAVGTGPYTLVEWRSGDRIVLKANSDYWGDKPIEQDVVVRFITDPAARLAEIRAGSIDFTVELSPDQLPEVSGDPNLKPVFRESFNVGYLGLNTSYEPLAKLEVRQAIAMAINRPEIVKAFWGDTAVVADSFVPPSMAEYANKDFKGYAYDPKKAKELLTKAGYPNGFPLELWYMPVSRPYFPTPKPIAEAFAADLSAVGINVTFKTKDWAAYIPDSKKPPGYQSFMLGWTGDYGDPDNFYYYHYGPGGTSDLGNWKDPKVFGLLEKARSVDVKSEREKLYAEADKITSEAALRIPIAHSRPLVAHRANISGWVPSPLGAEQFSGITKT